MTEHIGDDLPDIRVDKKGLRLNIQIMDYKRKNGKLYSCYSKYTVKQWKGKQHIGRKYSQYTYLTEYTYQNVSKTLKTQ